MKTPPISRRHFLGQAACAGFGLSGLMSAMGTLRLFNATLSAQGVPGNDFKALVCLFLYGGNDANNVVVPYDTSGYNAYAAARGILALPRTGLLPIAVPGGDGREYALHPSLNLLQPLFNNGKLAVVANVGTLVAPITKAEFESGGAAVPPYLFSHNDQQLQWQTSVPDSPKKTGWGGRLADLLQSLNAGSQVSMNISIAGNNFFQVGNEVYQYHVTTEGSVGLHEYGAGWAPRPQMFSALEATIGAGYAHLFESEYARTTERAIATDTLVRETLEGIPSYADKFPNSTSPGGEMTYLAAQLRMILRLIAARQALGMRRQIYFCSMGGFDTHDAQLDDHAYLVGVIDRGLADFYQATVDLGLSESVTLFTASDFNRTYTSNGKGSDHAWGSHQLVLGGAVQGGQLYGRMPVLQPDGPDDTGGRGSWIPTTSVDEYSATLARWFGVQGSDMPLVLPNIGRFAHPDLGFMGA
jgi:uncharacterized protein (DUF1501 family)